MLTAWNAATGEYITREDSIIPREGESEVEKLGRLAMHARAMSSAGGVHVLDCPHADPSLRSYDFDKDEFPYVQAKLDAVAAVDAAAVAKASTVEGLRTKIIGKSASAAEICEFLTLTGIA
jgi:hypothetical protein